MKFSDATFWLKRRLGFGKRYRGRLRYAVIYTSVVEYTQPVNIPLAICELLTERGVLQEDEEVGGFEYQVVYECTTKGVRWPVPDSLLKEHSKLACGEDTWTSARYMPVIIAIPDSHPLLDGKLLAVLDAP